MGNGPSTSTAAVLRFGIATHCDAKPLTPQRQFEATIHHRRYVRQESTTLEFEDQFWNKPRDHTIEIRDVTRNKVLFKVAPPKTDGTTRRVLLDAYGVPVVGMETYYPLEPSEANETAFAVIPGGYAATQELFRFETRFAHRVNPLTLALADGRVRICVVGNWQWLARGAAVTIQRGGPESSLFLIARQSPVGDVRDGKYRLEIAAGVDLALMVLFAAAMDEMSHKHAQWRDHRYVKLQAEHYLKRQQKTNKMKKTTAATTPPTEELE